MLIKFSQVRGGGWMLPCLLLFSSSAWALIYLNPCVVDHIQKTRGQSLH